MKQPPDPSNAVDKFVAPTTVQERSFPLVALLQFATFWAAMAACIDGRELGAALDRIPEQPIAAALVAAFAVSVSGLLGFAVGLGQLRMWRSAAAGAAVGMLYGIIVLAVYVAPAPLERAAAAAAILVVTTIAFRIGSA